MIVMPLGLFLWKSFNKLQLNLNLPKWYEKAKYENSLGNIRKFNDKEEIYNLDNSIFIKSLDYLKC